MTDSAAPRSKLEVDLDALETSASEQQNLAHRLAGLQLTAQFQVAGHEAISAMATQGLIAAYQRQRAIRDTLVRKLRNVAQGTADDTANHRYTEERIAASFPVTDPAPGDSLNRALPGNKPETES